MVKNFTLLEKSKLKNGADNKEVCNQENNIIFYVEDNTYSPSQKTIDFILNYSKCYRTSLLKSGRFVEMNIN